MLILGIETSCDETAASIVEDGRTVLSHVVSTQHELHEKYQGVVPEIASRAHMERILPVIREAMERAGVGFGDLGGVAVGNRPGLIGSLLVGVSAAKAISWAARKPILGVDHIQAHLYAAALADKGEPPVSPIVYPALGLVVSGGHTTLYRVDSPIQMTVLGRTIDDAVGEAYDKAAVILGLGYPGGPKLDKLAREAAAAGVKLDPEDALPRSRLSPESLDFSFSGLKTSLLYKVRGFPVGRGANATFERSSDDLSPQRQRELALSFQTAAVGIIITKMKRTCAVMDEQRTPARSILLGGGVSANSLLRSETTKLGAKLGIPVCLPKMAYCLDNAAMIGGLAFQQLEAGNVDDLSLPAIATSSV